MSDDGSLTEKRVYADRDGTTTAVVASDIGLTRVSISGDIVGEFSLERRGTATAVAAGDGRLAVATPDDVLVGTDAGFEATGFGSGAIAVGYRDGLVAAGDGRIARYDGGWTELSALEGVRRIDGGMVAAGSGIHRLDGTPLGLDDAADVSAAGTPLAATAEGLYYLANGWMTALDGRFTVVAGDGDRAHAATHDALYERTDDGSWIELELPIDERIVDVAYGDGVYAVTASGTVLVRADDGWRHRSLGLTGASGIAVP